MDPSQREIIEWELLWLRCRRSDPEALEALVRKFEQPLFYFVRRIVANEADAWDVLQQVWMRVLSGMHTVAAASALKAWIYRTARNTSLNHIRGERRYRAAVEGNPARSLELDDPGPAEFEGADQVHRALDQLELPYREALTLYFLEQMSVHELAEVLEIPEGTVKSRLYHGRARLRSILEKQDEKRT